MPFLVVGVPLAVMLADLIGELPSVGEVQAFAARHETSAVLIAVVTFACWGAILSFPFGAFVFAVLGLGFGGSVAGWAAGDPMWQAALGCLLAAGMALFVTVAQVCESMRFRRVSRVPRVPLTQAELRRRHAEAFGRSFLSPPPHRTPPRDPS